MKAVHWSRRAGDVEDTLFDVEATLLASVEELFQASLSVRTRVEASLRGQLELSVPGAGDEYEEELDGGVHENHPTIVAYELHPRSRRGTRAI